MAQVLRHIAAVIAGAFVVLAIAVAVELFSAVVYPTPPDFKETMEEIRLHVERCPQWLLALVVPMWAGAAFAGAWISGWIGNRWTALFVGLLSIAAIVLNVSMLPYTVWFKIVILLAAPLAVAMGCVGSSGTGFLAGRRK